MLRVGRNLEGAGLAVVGPHMVSLVSVSAGQQ
jgi:hypothetical protein